MTQSNQRRNFVKRAAYVAPAILTLAAVPSYAKFGSDKLGLSNGNINGLGNNGDLASRYRRSNGNNVLHQSNYGDVASRYRRNNGSIGNGNNNNQGNNDQGNNNQGSNGGGGSQSAPPAQSSFRSNPYADYRARRGFIDYSGTRGPDSD
jgi:hypothetical protein